MATNINTKHHEKIMTKVKEMRQFSKKELDEMLLKNKKKLEELRFALSSGKVKNIREIRAIRRDIARINTLLKAY